MNRDVSTAAEVLASARAFAVPLHDRFRGITVREGILLGGPAGWGEFAPFRDYDDEQCVPWLMSALESAVEGWPPRVRTRVEVNTTVPVVSPGRAAELVARSGCRTAKVKVAGLGEFREVLGADADRLRAVRETLGPSGHIRVDANGAWAVAEALSAIPILEEAAAGLQYVEQPCRTIGELAQVRRSVHVPVAADESIRLAGDPEKVALAGAADIAVLKVAPLGGVRRAARIAQGVGLRVVISSAVDTSVGLAAGLALAGAVPQLDLACGLGTTSLLDGDVTSAPVKPSAGWVDVPEHAPDPDRLGEFAADAELTRWWMARLTRVAALLGSAPLARQQEQETLRDQP